MKEKKRSGAYIFINKIKDKASGNILKKFFLDQKSPDVFLINDESVGIEKTREIKKFLASKPIKDERKAVVITNGEGLTTEAQNGMLKTLEELSGDQLVVICSPQKNILLPTVVSRCQLINVKNKTKSTGIFDKLIKLNKKEKVYFFEKEMTVKKMTKSELVSFLDQLIEEAHEKMVNLPEESKMFCSQINKIKYACKLAKANISPQSTIDWLLISL
jgi:DNA polymerase III gamma/tau subunit